MKKFWYNFIGISFARVTSIALLTIIIGYGYGCTIDLPKFGSTLRVKKFNLEVLIFLWRHVINDRDLKILQNLKKSKKIGMV